MRTAIALKCMTCDEVFNYCVNGVRLGITALPKFYNIGYSVCDSCTQELIDNRRKIQELREKLKR